MTVCENNCWQIAKAAVVAALVVFVSDLTYRAMIGRADSSVARIPVDPAVMGQLPLQIGGWTGLDVPLDDAVKRATGVDMHISRQYLRLNGMEAVGLYVASGGRTRALVAHRPEVCYTANGWTLFDRRAMALPLGNGQTLSCTAFQFSRGGFDSERKAVLCYYIVDGEYCGDASLLRSKVWYGSDRVDYAVQVQIAAGAGEIQPADSGMALVSAFAVDSALSIAQLFTHHEVAPSTGEASQLSGAGR